MKDIIFKIWWMMGLLPSLIFVDASKKFSNFLKNRNMYSHWDIWHSFIVLALVILAILWITGYY